VVRRVLNQGGHTGPQGNAEGGLEELVCGVDWVTSTRTNFDPTSDIAVANESLGGPGTDDGNCGLTNGDPLHLAICNSVDAGVLFVVAAMNEGSDLQSFVPASYDEVLTATAMWDTDGKPGGLNEAPESPNLSSKFCANRDDTYVAFSNFAGHPGDSSRVLAAPGVCILSTLQGSTYGYFSGTSKATPHVSNTAVLCIASGDCNGSPAATRQTLLEDAESFNTLNPGYGLLGDPLHPLDSTHPYGGNHVGFLVNASLYSRDDRENPESSQGRARTTTGTSARRLISMIDTGLQWLSLLGLAACGALAVLGLVAHHCHSATSRPLAGRKGATMRSHRTSLTLALAVLLVLMLAGAAQAASPARLLAKFQPVTVFHPGEEFRPIPVEGFVGDSNLEAAISETEWVVVDPDPSADSLPTASPTLWRLNQRDCFAGAPLGDLACYVAGAADEPGRVVYGRVARPGERIVLQYWYFYYDNLYRYPFLPTGAIWQSHEGDWEVVNVVLAKYSRKPLRVGYSQHCSGETRPWAVTPRVNGHPKVYVAHGSHANYFEPGLHEFDRACLPAEVIGFFQQADLPLPADVAEEGPAAGPGSLGLDETVAVRRVTPDEPAWIQFPGFWGEYEYFHAPDPIGTRPFGISPVGPAFHEVWQHPLATLATWR
jgi:Subtilase family